MWDRFPTVGHADPDWAQREAALRGVAERALARDSAEELVNEAAWGMARYDMGRQVAEPEKLHMYRIQMAVWASMYEANRKGTPEVFDEDFRVVRHPRNGAR